MNLEILQKTLEKYPSFRIKQATEAIFKQCLTSWDKSNLPADIKNILIKKIPLNIKSELFSSDDNKSIKGLIELTDHSKIETVLMRYKNGKNVVCVSCQIGCPMGCKFCATGDMGFIRNLTSSEIIKQLLLFARYLKKEHKQITNVVFMGMGEPFLNYDEVMTSIKIINNEKYFNIGARKIKISTCGLIDGLKKLMKEKIQIKLALSIHAPNDKLRSQLMPINEKHSLDELLKIVKKYLQISERKVMIEYLMLNNVNDTEEHAHQLSHILKKHLGRLFMINLIAYNDYSGKYQPSTTENIQQFRQILEEDGIEVTQRFKLGQSIKGGCGQLATEK